MQSENYFDIWVMFDCNVLCNRALVVYPCPPLVLINAESIVATLLELYGFILQSIHSAVNLFKEIGAWKILLNC